MLKISVVDTRSKRRLIVEGTLLSPWTEELMSIWKESVRTAQNRNVVLDFAGVTRISDDAMAVLSDLIDQGARFASGGVLTRHVLQQLSRERQKLSTASRNQSGESNGFHEKFGN
jgi:ABC-type transporter Mla MlaB component